MTRIEKKEILSDEKTKKVAMQVSTVSIVVNLLLSVFKLLAGIIGKSGAMVSDAIFPAVEKGVRLAAEKGVLAGYPVVGLKATLLDGSYHPVDSSEMAFIMAAKLAYKAAMPEAGPVILEPIHTLKAHVPNDNTGDIMGDVTKRRGRVLGMEPDEDGMQTVIAEVPLAELSNFTTFIRQITQGRGWFTTEFARYEILPEMLVPAVVEQAKKLGNLDEGAED